MTVDQAELAKLKQSTVAAAKAIMGATIALGVLFIIFGILVKTYPVPITITSLVLYVGAAIIFGYLDPSTLARGWLIKLLIIVGLVKSIQSALAYQREQQRQPGLDAGMMGNPMA
jgi:hypothetical protein